MLTVNDNDVDELLDTQFQKTVKKSKKSDKKTACQTSSVSKKSDKPKVSKAKSPQERKTMTKKEVKKTASEHDATSDLADSQSTDVGLQKELKDMQDKYEELKKVGISEADKRFDEFKMASDAQIKDYKLLVQRLEDNIKLLEKSKAAAVSTEEVELEIAAVKEQAKASLMEHQSNWQSEKEVLLAMLEQEKTNTSNLANELERLKAHIVDNVHADAGIAKDGLLNLFQELSGLSVLCAEKDSTHENVMLYTCYQTGSRGGDKSRLIIELLFKISAPRHMDGSSSVEYIPCLNMEFNGHKTSADIVESLPEYLTEEIEFDVNMLSQFFLRMVTYLNNLSN